jgi:hypothetical protein
MILNTIIIHYYNRSMQRHLFFSQLKIIVNANYSCEQFYKYILPQTHLLKEIRKNRKCEQ